MFLVLNFQTLGVEYVIFLQGKGNLNRVAFCSCLTFCLIYLFFLFGFWLSMKGRVPILNLAQYLAHSSVSVNTAQHHSVLNSLGALGGCAAWRLSCTCVRSEI